MREIGIRELKQALSEILRAVGRGDHVRVTNRGQPLADIVPAGSSSGGDALRQLIVQGRVVPPGRGRPARAPRLVRSSQSASSLVLAERDQER